jgi:hypothetical protein
MKKIDKKIEFTGKDIPPDISEEENTRNVENFVNALCKADNIEGYSHCAYIDGKIHIYIKK